MAESVSQAEIPRRGRKMHPLPIRIMHWVNAVAMIVLIMSGWKIYNDDVIFGFLHFPEAIVLGIWAQHALQWHFAAMWILALNGIAYVSYGLIGGRFRRMLLPIWPREVIREIGDALRLRLQHTDLTHYNAVQRLLYAGIIVVITIQVVTGLAIWKPVQFQGLVAIFGSFQGARLAHFLGMTAIVLFLIVHITLALLVPKTIVAMVTGGPRLADEPPPDEPPHEPPSVDEPPRDAPPRDAPLPTMSS